MTGSTEEDTKSLLGWFWYKSYRVLCDVFSFHANSNQIFSLFWIKQFLHAHDVNNIGATKVITTMSLGSIAPSPHAPHRPATGTLSRWHQAASHKFMVVLWWWRWCKHYMVACSIIYAIVLFCMHVVAFGGLDASRCGWTMLVLRSPTLSQLWLSQLRLSVALEAAALFSAHAFASVGL